MRSRTRTSWHPDAPAIKCGHQTTSWAGQIISDFDIFVSPGDLSGYSEECWDELHAKHGGHYTEDGILLMTKVKKFVQPIPLNIEAGGVLRKYTGDIYPALHMGDSNIPSPLDWRYPPSNDRILDLVGDASSWGATGYNRFRPGKPKVSLSVFLAELRELPRLLMTRASEFRHLSGAGKGYLHYQFGWKPFLSDLQKMFSLQKQLEKEFAKIRRNNGEWKKVGGTLSDTLETLSWEAGGAGVYPFTPPLDGTFIEWGTPRVKGTYTKSRRIWYSARAKYYITAKQLDSPAWRANTIRKLYGLTITPSDVWELIPWTWLIDYFGNAGDVIANIVSTSAVDYVTKNSCVMCQTTIKHEQESLMTVIDHNSPGGQLPISGTLSIETVVKQRTPANPFGFGLTNDDLSGRQLAILGALGLSKL